LPASANPGGASRFRSRSVAPLSRRAVWVRNSHPFSFC
jgi:hypothetical protein